jgi:hypothetical protein
LRRKNRPKCSPTHFLLKSIHKFYHEKSTYVEKKLGLLPEVISNNVNNHPIAQSGHPGIRTAPITSCYYEFLSLFSPRPIKAKSWWRILTHARQ